MTPEAQRIAIAEACGWFLMDGNWYMPNGAKSTADGGRNEPPVFLNDLNAMHEAEKVLTNAQHETFSAVLLNLVCSTDNDQYPSLNYPNFGKVLHATAAQRAEAFLLTLNICK